MLEKFFAKKMNVFQEETQIFKKWRAQLSVGVKQTNLQAKLQHKALLRMSSQTSLSSFVSPACMRKLVSPSGSPSLLTNERQKTPLIHLNLTRRQEDKLLQEVSGGQLVNSGKSSPGCTTSPPFCTGLAD